MGAVAVESRTIGRGRGYPIIEATLYIYCDNCGSFNIKIYIRFIKLLIMAIVVGFLIGIFITMKSKTWLPCFIPFGLLALYLPWRDILLSYKCRNCKNVKITTHNTLHYPPYDKSVVDVPDKLTQKRYIDEDALHFQQFL